MFGFGPDFAQRFTEPDHARPGDSATTAVGRKFRQRRAAIRPIAAAFGTLQPPDITMKLEHSAAAGPFMQAVHVLRDQGEVEFGGFELYQSSMSGIRLG